LVSGSPIRLLGAASEDALELAERDVGVAAKDAAEVLRALQPPAHPRFDLFRLEPMAHRRLVEGDGQGVQRQQ
jgi:hypothetical protein